MTQHVDPLRAGQIVLDMVAVIQANQQWLSELDGATGDGDHGVNMAKGFRLAGAKLQARGSFGLAEGLETLGDTLLGDIGGSMGPLYGTFFIDMAEQVAGAASLDREVALRMLQAGLAAVQDLGEAKQGDKTLVDVLVPATEALRQAVEQDCDLTACMAAMKAAATAGLEATRGMVARIGRAARLGERSRGSLDAGAASCSLLLGTLADGLARLHEA